MNLRNLFYWILKNKLLLKYHLITWFRLRIRKLCPPLYCCVNKMFIFFEDNIFESTYAYCWSDSSRDSDSFCYTGNILFLFQSLFSYVHVHFKQNRIEIWVTTIGKFKSMSYSKSIRLRQQCYHFSFFCSSYLIFVGKSLQCFLLHLYSTCFCQRSFNMI